MGHALMARAAGFGPGAGWVLDPPVTRLEAEACFGAPIHESAWLEIHKAFERHGRRLGDLEGSRNNQNPNDERSWHKRKSDTQRRIDTASNALDGINRKFLVEAENNVSLNRSGGLESYDSVKRLNRALDEILFLSWIMREAEPIGREIPTDSESRKLLARDIFKALEGSGAKLSNGWAIGQRPPTRADLTGFERLTELMRIHLGNSPTATSKWLRDAMGEDS
jgi:hypothetical protein